MAGKTKPMSIVKQILRALEQGQSKKSIVRDLGVSKNTVRRYIRHAMGSGIALEELLRMDDLQLEAVLNRQVTVSRDHQYDLEELFPWIKEELRRTGVTRFVLWREYRSKYPDGYSYSQFCYHYQQWLRTQNVSMVIEHEPGDKVYIDFAGKKLKYHDRSTGKDVEVEFFAGILGYSQMSFACVVESQSSEDFLFACSQMLSYFGGSPRAIVPDNLKSGVKKANRYEPDITQSFSDFCNHYGVAALPTRVAKPKDKPLVEGLIKILYTRIFAPLRNRTFYSMAEVNLAIAELLELHNNTPFSQKPGTRQQVFEEQEKHLLQDLPAEVFEMKHYRQVTVQKNSHILLGEDKHYYSVPMRYIGKKVSVIYTSRDVNIFLGQERVAYHLRNRRLGKYTTLPDHVPSSHRYLMGLTPQHFIQWGQGVCSDVGLYVEKLIESKRHPEQAYNSCRGLQALARRIGKKELIEACREGHNLKVYNYKFIQRVMENKDKPKKTSESKLPVHENIRGPQLYQ